MTMLCVLLALALQGETTEADARAWIEQLGDPDPEVRSRAHAGLMAAGPRFRPLVEPLAASANPEVASRAREVLTFYAIGLTAEERVAIDERLDGVMRHLRTGGQIDEKLVDDAFWGEEIADLWHWFQPGNAWAAPYLAWRLGEEPEASTRALIALALNYTENPEAAPALRRALEDASPLVCHNACVALGKLGDGEAIPALARLLEDAREVYFVHGDGGGSWTVALQATETMERILGFPVDPVVCLAQRFPFADVVTGGVPPTPPESALRWWSAHGGLRTLEEWREAARAEARDLAAPSRSATERLAGALTLLAFPGYEREVFEAALAIVRDPALDAQEQVSGHSKALALLIYDPAEISLGTRPFFKGNVAPLTLRFVGEVLHDPARARDRFAALGIAWKFTCPRGTWYHVDARPVREPVPALRSCLSSEAPEERTLAAATLCALAEQDAAGPLIEFLEAARRQEPPDWFARAARWLGTYDAIWALSKAPTPEARPILRAYASHEDAYIQTHALIAWAATRDPEVVPILEERLASRPSEEIALALLEADEARGRDWAARLPPFRSLAERLLRRGDTELLGHFLDVDRQYPDQDIFQEGEILHEALRISSSVLIPALIDLREHESPSVSRNACAILEWAGAPTDHAGVVRGSEVLRAWWGKASPGFPQDLHDRADRAWQHTVAAYEELERRRGR